LLDGLSQRNMLSTSNIIFTADHGMTQLARNRVINLGQYMRIADARIATYFPVLNIFPNPGKEQTIYNALKGAHPNLTYVTSFRCLFS